MIIAWRNVKTLKNQKEFNALKWEFAYKESTQFTFEESDDMGLSESKDIWSANRIQISCSSWKVFWY